jgi:cation diffusion facilitator family transporter
MQADAGIQWDHPHDFGIDNNNGASKVKVVFALTTVVMVLEIAAGVWSGSMALLADGWHMGTHSFAFAIAMFAYFYAKKHANNRAFSFGTGKVNYLGGFASAVALAIVALMMAIESVQRLFEPHAIHFNEAIMVAIIGLVVNIASVFLLHDDHHHENHEHEHEHEHDHDHHHHNDQNMKAAYFHVLADTLTSVLAIGALLAGKFYGWIWMDSLVGIVGAVVISRWSYVLIKESSEVLLDKSVGSASLPNIVDAIEAGDETVITDVHIWKIASTHQAAILSVSAKNPLQPNEYKEILKQCVPRLSHVSIEILKV